MPLAPEFDGHADEDSVQAVLAFEVGGAGEDLLLIFKDGLHHLDRGGGGGVIGAAGFEIFDDLGSAVAGAIDKAFESGRVEKFG